MYTELLMEGVGGDQGTIWEKHILHSEIQVQLPTEEMLEELEINILTAGPLRSEH